ncbi:hypothetical protein AYM37_15355 (plasmid) [Staphylococcus aureus]|nr:hypothetical protein AYM28_15355 [Staphylococcus aureus]AQR53190.1 hypothetical protein AYM37_15355 [Staphylococcus aureus]
MFLNIVIDINSILYLVKQTIKILFLLILISVPVFCIFRALINVIKFKDYQMFRTLSISSAILIVMYIGFYCIFYFIFNIDVKAWIIN